MRHSITSSRKSKKIRTHRENSPSRNEDDLKTTSGEILPGNREITTLLHCVPLEESEKNRILMRMSHESIRIFNETKWSEKGFIPSFKITDKKLIKASRRAYKILGYSE
jgi:hypothetical protein